jgi:hypothetical protein
MNQQTTRTVTFLAVAAVSIGIAAATHYAYKPVDLADFSDVGAEFYPDFTDPSVATGLRVAAYNAETGRTDTFRVEFKEGLWQIPTHHGYPADGEERLARVAASIIGVQRQALVERTPAAHRRYDLLDPLDDDVSGTEGHGARITLYQGGDVLVDFIVGRQVEDEPDVYHVRRADENRFYTANLGRLEISTRFADWIHQDILDVRRNDIRRIIIDRYRISADGEQVREDQLDLTRESATADWKLEDLDESKQKLKASEINSMLTALDDLQIVGVRKKPEGLSAGLRAEEGAAITRFDLLDLQDKGFYFHQGHIFSNEGEMIVGTSEGVVYILRFGNEFSGSEVDIEVGKPRDESEPAEEGDAESEDAPANEEDPADPESEEAEEHEEDSGLKKSRYLFVTVQFDEDLIGEKPVPPTKPEPPETSASPESSDDAADPGNESDSPDESDSNEDAEQKPADADADTPADDEPAEEKDPQKEYEQALERYELELEAHEFRLKDHEAKVEQGRERVSELNRRFADWYYVISADVYNRLKKSREDLVEEIEQPDEEASETGQPEAGTAPETPDSDKPEPDKSDSDEAEPDNAEPDKSDAEKTEPEQSESPAPQDPEPAKDKDQVEN